MNWKIKKTNNGKYIAEDYTSLDGIQEGEIEKRRLRDERGFISKQNFPKIYEEWKKRYSNLRRK